MPSVKPGPTEQTQSNADRQIRRDPTRPNRRDQPDVNVQANPSHGIEPTRPIRPTRTDEPEPTELTLQAENNLTRLLEPAELPFLARVIQSSRPLCPTLPKRMTYSDSVEPINHVNRRPIHPVRTNFTASNDEISPF